MDLKVDKGSQVRIGASPSGWVSGSNPGAKQHVAKSCSDCQTTRTPLWRGGPAGPKSLCNACGIKYNKKRREVLGLDKTRIDKRKKKRKTSGGSGSGDMKSKECPGGGGVGLGQSLKTKLMTLGGEMMLNERSWKLMGTLREEEEAAILLMALSCGCGSLYA